MQYPSLYIKNSNFHNFKNDIRIRRKGAYTKMKYVLVTGGVVSGLGKGVTASSIGVLLKACGHRVTSIKIGELFWHVRGPSRVRFHDAFLLDMHSLIMAHSLVLSMCVSLSLFGSFSFDCLALVLCWAVSLSLSFKIRKDRQYRTSIQKTRYETRNSFLHLTLHELSLFSQNLTILSIIE